MAILVGSDITITVSAPRKSLIFLSYCRKQYTYLPLPFFLSKIQHSPTVQNKKWKI